MICEIFKLAPPLLKVIINPKKYKQTPILANLQDFKASQKSH